MSLLSESLLEQSLQQESLHDALIELYLNVKVRSNDEITHYDNKIFEQEKDKLRCTDPHTIIEYIRSSVEILMNLKQEEFDAEKKKKKSKRKAKLKADDDCDIMSVTSQSLWSTLEKFKEGPPQEYEEAIIKLEGDIRMHIRVEQQMRLHIENLQQKIEDLTRDNDNRSTHEKAKLKYQLAEDAKKHEKQVKEVIERYQNKLEIISTKYEKQIADLVKQINRNKSTSRKEGSIDWSSKSAKHFKPNFGSSQHNFSHIINDNNVSRNHDFDEDTDSTPADELNSWDGHQVNNNINSHANESILINFYKKIDEKKGDDFKTKKSFNQLHEQLKSNKTQHSSKPSYNFETKSKIFEHLSVL